MAEGYLDIGTLTGTIEMDDRLTGSLEMIVHKVEHFAEEFLGEFTGLAFGIGAVATAITGIAATITTLAVKGSEINDVREGFDRLAKGAQNAEEILKAMRQGVVGTIPDLRLMQDANRLLGAGVRANAEDFKTLTTAAHVLANEGYGNIETILGSLNRAMITGSTFRIKQLGVSIDATKAEKEYAAAIGVSAGQLTRDQQLIAVRGALIEALGKRVEAAGQLHLSFAERFDAAMAALKNWAEELEAAIARSPAVIGAFDAISDAVQKAFGGDGQALIESLVKWVERFANAVTTFAPPIIRLFGGIYDVLQTIFTAVEAAWDSLPDWLKTVIKDAAVASIAIWGIQKALDAAIKTAIKGKEGGLLSGLGGGGGGGLGIETVASSATIASGSIDSLKFLVSLPKGIGATREALRGLGDTFGVLGKYGPVLSTFGKGLEALGAKRAEALGVITTLGSYGTAAATATVASGPLIVALAGTAAAAAIGWQAWKLYKEHGERAAAQIRQNTVDESNLKRINDTLGTSYTDLNEAVKAANEHAAKLRHEHELDNDASARQAEFAEAHKKEIEDLTRSFQDQATKINFTKEAFATLTEGLKSTDAHTRTLANTTLYNRNVQDSLIKAFEEQMAQHINLNAEQKEYYERVTRSRAADVEATAARVMSATTIKKQADELRYWGRTEEEVAQKLGMTVAQLHEAEKPMAERIAALEREGLSEAAVNERLGLTAETRARVNEIIKQQNAAQDALTASLDAYNLALTHGGLDARRKQSEDQLAQDIRNLRASKDWTQKAEDEKRAEYERTEEVKKMQDEEGIAGSQAAANKERDLAKNKLDIMLRDVTAFHAADIQDAQQDYNDKARAAEHWSATASEAEKKAAEAAKAASEERQAALKKEMDAQQEWADHWHNLTITMSREQAEAIVKTQSLSGNMWADFTLKVAESSLKLLDEAQLKQDMAQYKTIEDYKKMAEQAKKTYDAMKSSGLYTAQTLQEAWKKYTDAQMLAMGITENMANTHQAQQVQQNVVRAAAPAAMDANRFGFRMRPNPNDLRWGSGPGATPGAISPVHFAAGSIVIQYPVMSDPRAKNEIARLLGDAFLANMQSRGQRT